MAISFGDDEVGPEKLDGPKLSLDHAGSKAEEKD